MKFEDLSIKQQLIAYIKASKIFEPNARFCTENPKYHAAADELIAEGVLVELENPDASNRAFALKENDT